MGLTCEVTAIIKLIKQLVFKKMPRPAVNACEYPKNSLMNDKIVVRLVNLMHPLESERRKESPSFHISPVEKLNKETDKPFFQEPLSQS